MNIYKVDIRRTTEVMCTAESKEFEIGCTADSLDRAMSLLYGEIINNGVLLLRSGKEIPESSKVEEGNLYITVDFDRALRESFKSETSRRNVTLPTWMDYKLRLYGIDASRLFQDAAEKAIEKYEEFRRK